MPTVGAEEDSDEKRAGHLKRHRLEAEVAMLQSDRSRLVRQSDELEAGIRLLEKALKDRELALEVEKSSRNRIIQKIQEIDAELLRAKRSAYQK